MRALFACLLLVLAMPDGGARGLSLDESNAKRGEWGYRPSKTHPAALNPPGFTWRPCEKATTYRLQVATDEQFDDIVYARTDLPWNAHCPSQTLPVDRTLYWRYAATDKRDKVSRWSQTRTFTIPADAVSFPLAPTSELIERLPASHPRLFFRPEDIPNLKAQAIGDLSKRWTEINAQAVKILKNLPDTSEPPLYPEGIEYKGAAWKKIWWGNRRRVIAVANGAATLGFAYRISGDERYAQTARDLIMAMTEWDTEGSTQYRYNDEAAMPVLYYTPRAYTWAYPGFSERERNAVIEMMQQRGRQAFEYLRHSQHLWKPFRSHNNRCWHFLGEVAITFHDVIPEAQTWLDYAMTVLYTCYPAWGDADGGWHEGSSYWRSYTGRFMWWAAIIRSAFDINVFERPFYNRVAYYPMYLMPPGTETGGFGDMAQYNMAKHVAPLTSELAANAGNPHWQWYAEACAGTLPNDYIGFLGAAHARGLKPQVPTELPTSTVFNGVGLAVMNSNLLDGKQNVQIHFKSSPYGRQSHGYNANNAFLLNLHGQRALIRTGRRDVYGSKHHTQWMWHSKSDNAILVNGEGQFQHTAAAPGRITAFKTSQKVDVAIGEAGESYANLDRWTRRIAFFKSHAVLIHDVLEAPEPSTYTWTLHANEKPFIIDGNQVGWTGEPGELDIRFITPDDLAITQTDQYDPPPAKWSNFNLNEWHLSAQTQDKKTAQQFLTLIVIDDAKVAVKREEGSDTVRITLPDGEAVVRLGTDTLTLKGCGVDWTFTN